MKKYYIPLFFALLSINFISCNSENELIIKNKQTYTLNELNDYITNNPIMPPNIKSGMKIPLTGFFDSDDENKRNHLPLYLDYKIQGKNYRFLFSSGNFPEIFSNNLMGLNINASDSYDQYIIVHDRILNGEHTYFLPLSIYNMDLGLTPDGKRICGFIGSDLISYAWESLCFDYRNKEIIMDDPNVDLKTGYKIKYSSPSEIGYYRIPIKINNILGIARLDTSIEDCYLDPEHFNLSPDDGILLSDDDSSDYKYKFHSPVQIGDLTLKDFHAYPIGERQLEKAADCQVLLGIRDFFDTYKVYFFDYKEFIFLQEYPD